VVWRVVSVICGAGAFVFGGMLAWQEKSDGIAVASAFAVAAIAFVFGLAGVVPASVKVGDVELALQQAKQQGSEEGQKRGVVQGITTAAVVKQCMNEGLVPAEQVKSALTQALTTDAPLDTDAIGVPKGVLDLPNLGAEGAAVAQRLVENLAERP
jgi:hypothetical protein